LKQRFIVDWNLKLRRRKPRGGYLRNGPVQLQAGSVVKPSMSTNCPAVNYSRDESRHADVTLNAVIVETVPAGAPFHSMRTGPLATVASDNPLDLAGVMRIDSGETM